MLANKLINRSNSIFNKEFLRSLAIIAVPIILQNFINSFINMLDTVMVGKLGAIPIAAVGLGNQIFFIFNLITFGICSGGAIFIAQYWGKRDADGIHKSIGIMMLLAVIVSSVFAIAGIFAPEFLISLYSKDKEVILEGGKYLRLAAISYPVTAISFAFAQACRSTEEVRIPMVATIVSLLVNLVLNFLFIFGVNFADFVLIPAMGASGAGLATIFSRIVQFVVIVSMIYKRKLFVAGTVKEFLSFSRSFSFKYLKITFPVIINETLWSFGITLQNVIFARTGTEAIAAFNIMGTINQLVWVFIIGVGNAAAVLVGKKIGEGNPEEAYKFVGKVTRFMPLMAVFVGILLVPLSFMLPLFFSVDASILNQASIMLLVLLVVYPFRSFNMVMVVGVCRAGGDTVFCAIADILFLYVLALPLAAIASFLWHVEPWLIFVCVCSEEIFKMLLLLWRLLSKKWLHNVVA